MDTLTQAARSALMRQIRGRDTTPEMVIRSIVRDLRLRCHLNYAGLPGKPDIAFPRRKMVIFVHGCFWHRHTCRRGQSTPASRKAFWQSKFAANMKRDSRNRRALRLAGWKVLVVWECETIASRRERVRRRIANFLQRPLILRRVASGSK